MNQSSPSGFEEKPAGGEQAPKDVFRSAVIMLGAAIAVTLFYAFLAWRTGAWQMAALSALIGVFCLVSAAALVLIRRNQAGIGSWMIVAGMLVIFPAAALLIAGVGILLGGVLLLLALAFVSQTLPAKQARGAMFASVVAALFTAALDLLSLQYRLFVPELQTFLPAITLVVLLAFAFFAARQSRAAISANLQLKLVLWSGSLLVGSSIILVSYSVINARQTAIESAQQAALAIAQGQALQARAEAEIPLDMARGLAQALTAIKQPGSSFAPTRDDVNAMLKQVLAKNPAFLGTYTLWEPNAFDGADAAYRGSVAHDDSGRFIPYWVRGENNSIDVIALTDYETPGLGDWYLLPRQTHKEVVIAPLVYPIQGVDTVMASFVVPIVVNEKFYGIAGIDAPIAFVQSIVDSVNLYDGKAGAALMTASGTLIGVRNRPDLVNRPATEIYPDFAALQARITAGEAFVSVSPDGQFLRVFAPVDLGQTGTHWSFGLTIPFTEITAPAGASALRQITISVVLVLFAMALLWFLIGQVVRPVRALTAVAQEISRGNLDVTAETRATDETGLLAKTINLMIGQLREAFSTLETRIADRTRGLQLVTEVGRSVTQVRALDSMLKDAVELIRSRFDLYYAQVYLVNPTQTELVLQAGTGAVGQQLLARGHHLTLDTGSLNGRAAQEKNSVVVADSAASLTFRANPLLPDTRSEMAIPLLLGQNVIGVLDMQSAQANALNTENLSIFESLAGQLAVAIQNARLLEEAQQTRAELEAQARRQARSGWQDYQDALHQPEQTAFLYENNVVTALGLEQASALAEGALTAPIAVSGAEIGRLAVELQTEGQTGRNLELVEIVARQVAQHLENLRLLESAERYRAEAEQASRRLTVEGWQEYFRQNQNQTFDYFYDRAQVRPALPNTPTGDSALTLPIRVRDENLGHISVLDADGLEAGALELAQAITQRLGEHIESLRLLEETQRGQVELNKRAQQLAAVSEISAVSSRELDIEKMLAMVVHLTQRKFGLYHAHVFTFNEASQHLEIVACGWQEGDEREGTHGTTVIAIGQEQSLVARAARTRQPVVVNNVRADVGWLPNPQLPDTAAELAVPLVIGDQVLGVLDVQSERVDAFSKEDISIQITLAAQVATALQNARSFSRAQRQAERESMLNAINQKIQSATSVEAVLQIAARELGHALGAPRAIAQLSLKDKQ